MNSAGFTLDELRKIKGPPQGGAIWGSYAAALRERIIELRGEQERNGMERYGSYLPCCLRDLPR